MAQTASCRQCSKESIPVLNGRLAEHQNAQENPCTGSYGVVRPRDINDDGGLGGIPVKESSGPKPDLGYTVQPPLDENAKPYPGSEPRGDGHDLYGKTPNDTDEPTAAAEVRVQRADDGSLWVFAEGRNEPVQLEEANLCGEVEQHSDGTDRICIQRKGPHEHQWWPYVEPIVRLRPEHEINEIMDAMEVPPEPEGKVRGSDEHDQPLPTGNTEYPDVQSLVLTDIEQRRWVGIQRYGQGLKMFNGRDTLQDLYEELLDSVVYMRGLMEIRNASRERLIEVGTGALQAALEKEGIAPGDMVGITEEATENMATVIVDRLLDYFTAGKREPAE